MLKQQIVIDIQGETQGELAAALKAAGAALASKPLDKATDSGDVSFSISRGPTRADEWSPNTLYVAGTDATGKVIVSGTRTSFDAHKDHHIMSSALELSQAVELRGVDFGEHQLGSLLVRPVVKAKPLRDAVQIYDISHITDLANLDDEDIAYFVKDLPGLIATLKLVKDECDKRGTVLADVMPKLQFVADDDGTVTLNSKSASITAKGSDIVEGYQREQLSAAAK